jgi:hypothetical protein
VSQVEVKLEQIHKSINSRLEDTSTRLNNLQDQTSEWHIKTISAIEENKQQFSEITQKLDRLMEKERLESSYVYGPFGHRISLPELRQPTSNTPHQAEDVDDHVAQDPTYTSKISKLEGQINEMLKTFTEYREQNTNSTRAELRAMSERIESGQSLTTLYFDEAMSKYEESKRQCNHMYDDMNSNMNSNMNIILKKLNEITGPIVSTSTMVENNEARTEEYETKRNTREKATTFTTNLIPEHTFQMTAPTNNFIPTHNFQAVSNLPPSEPNYPSIVPSVFPLNPVKHSIIVPPSSAAPAFHGKYSESPTQFLIRVQEYAESVHAWDRPTLLNGISQFLRDSALEWYCQLRMSHRRPQTWSEFTDLFLAQFNSPVRKARQEQEWHECKQKENETINEFLVRLRALWKEQKPMETERDLVKHLFCRMRNDLLNMIGISRNASLDEVITEVQQIEDILYRRAKGERLAKQIKPASSSNAETSPYKRYNEDYTRRTTPWSNKEDSSYNYTRKAKTHQVNQVTPIRNRTTTEANMTQQLESYGGYCYTCGGYGHWTRYCPTQYGTYRQQRSKPNPKNVIGALDERTSRAPM